MLNQIRTGRYKDTSGIRCQYLVARCTKNDDSPCRNLAGVATSFGSLGADDICASGARFNNMLWVADKVHVQNIVCVKLFDDMLRRDAHG